ncbi:MAG: DinB family protein [Anaerolineae bacterium]|nr:DinB family protein [Anaerolineae bacterium]
MSDKLAAIEQVLTRLTDHPLRLATITDGLTPAQLRTPPAAEEWSINDVLAHLRSCADVWGGYINRILNEDKPKIRAISPRTYMKRTNYPDLEFAPSFAAFRTQRADLVTILEPLPLEAWSRTATVTKNDKVTDRSVLDYAQSICDHEGEHMEQLAEIAARLRT